jgi:hypothetical protein
MEKRCEICQKDFKAKVFWQKYCSGSCRLAAWALRKYQNPAKDNDKPINQK